MFKRLSFALACLLLVLACRVLDTDSRLEIIFIDVGSGSSVLVRTPDQRTCLIDGGPTFAGANEVWPLLDSMGIRELDYAIATNYSPDRIGGLDEVIRLLGGEEGILFDCYDRGGFDLSPEFREYRRVAASRRRKLRLGDAIELGDLTLRCVAADGRTLRSPDGRADSGDDRSIALLLTWWNFDLLITSDLTGDAESGRPAPAADIAEASGDVEMVCVGRRGALSAVSARMVHDLDPQVSIVCGGDSAAGLPAQRTINRLTRYRRQAYQVRRTDTDMIPRNLGQVVGGNIWVTVGADHYTVAGDTFRFFHPRRTGPGR